MRRWIRWVEAGVLLAAGLGLAALSGCAAMSKSECEQADWRALGVQDASGGLGRDQFTARRKACEKNKIGVDAAAYNTGYAEGQKIYCTAGRGESVAVRGDGVPQVCEGPNGQAFAQGYRNGLVAFCTPRGGYERARRGQPYLGQCPAETDIGLQVGLRIGQEVHSINQRLATIASSMDENKAVIENKETTNEARNDARRRNRDLADEDRQLRRSLDAAELRAAALPVAAGVAAPAPAPAPVDEIMPADSKLAGSWQLQSVRFKNPVDLNGDGRRSADAMFEYSDCERDQVLELRADGTAVVRVGSETRGCRRQARQYTWTAGERGFKEATYQAGRRIVTDRTVLVVELREGEGRQPWTLRVDSLDDQTLGVRAEMMDGSDSTSEALLSYRRMTR